MALPALTGNGCNSSRVLCQLYDSNVNEGTSNTLTMLIFLLLSGTNGPENLRKNFRTCSLSPARLFNADFFQINTAYLNSASLI